MAKYRIIQAGDNIQIQKEIISPYMINKLIWETVCKTDFTGTHPYIFKTVEEAEKHIANRHNHKVIKEIEING